MVPLAEGTDFGGSLRTPAAFCGVTGLRTTSGLIPKHPATLPWHDQSVEGPMARSAEDCALLLDAMTGLQRHGADVRDAALGERPPPGLGAA